MLRSFRVAALALCLAAVPVAADAPAALDVQLLRPVYRGAFYATEKVDRIEFRVTGIKGGGRLTYRLIGDAADSAVVAEGSGAATAATHTLPLRDLPVGAYRLHVTQMGAKGGPVATVSVPVRRLPPAPGSEVRVDEHGNLVVNGKPRVMIGWYGQVPTRDPRADVVALQNLETPTVVIYPKTDPIDERFRRHGIYTVANLEPGRLVYTFELWKKHGHPVPGEAKRLDAPSAEAREFYRKLVAKLQPEPGLFGYYIADEPEINDVRPAYLEALYRLLCELDPYHPVIVTNDSVRGIETHAQRACDVYNPDPYNQAFDYVPTFLRKVRAVRRPGQAVLLTPWQGSHEIHFSHDVGTYPSYPYRLTRHQYLSALALDCRGFTGYASDSFIPEPELRYGLPHLWREVRFLEPAIVAPPPAEPPAVDSDQPVIVWLRQANGHVYVIVTNDRKGTRQVRLKHASLRGVERLYSTGDGRDVPVAGGQVALMLPEGGAMVLTTDPAGRKLAPMATVEAEVAAQKLAARRPGNLLHSSRGVRARSSTGTTPWYEQCHYYAINGIRDDDGWHLTHAPLPGWLELVLPEPTALGRVVLYSTNLRDYDLRFLTPDGRTLTAEIRGNTREVAEHRIDPPVRALKLRVTARATRSGQAMIREIEAYALGGTAPPLAVQTAGDAFPAPKVPFDTRRQQVFWREDFKTFRSGPRFNYDGKDDFWVLDPKSLAIEPTKGDGLVCRPTAKAGYTTLSRFVDYDPAARYLHLDVAALTGDGYRFGGLSLSDGSGKGEFRQAHSANKAGRFTVDVHALHPRFADGTLQRALLQLHVVGPANAVTYRYRELALARLPDDGLSVTLADGAPLPETLKAGNTLLFYVRLAKPALDVTVDVQTGPGYSPLPLNGESSVQLVRTGAKDGREWAAAVPLGKGTGRFELKGYPMMFRAVVTGGAIRETFAPAFVSVAP